MGGRLTWCARGLVSFSFAAGLRTAALPPGEARAFCGFHAGVPVVLTGGERHDAAAPG